MGQRTVGNLIGGHWQYDCPEWAESFASYQGYQPEVVIAAFVRRASAPTTPTEKED